MNEMNEDRPDATDNEMAAPETGVEGNPAEINKDARTMAMLAHLLGLFSSFLGPLIIWLIKKDEHPFVDDQGKEALNFQLTVMIAHLIAFGITMVSCGFLFFVAFAPIIFQIIFSIIGAMKANEGIYYRYPTQHPND